VRVRRAAVARDRQPSSASAVWPLMATLLLMPLLMPQLLPLLLAAALAGGRPLAVAGP
jgi:hypothetical protein